MISNLWAGFHPYEDQLSVITVECSMQRRGLEEQGQEKIGSQISIALHYSLRVLLARMK